MPRAIRVIEADHILDPYAYTTTDTTNDAGFAATISSSRALYTTPGATVQRRRPQNASTHAVSMFHVGIVDFASLLAYSVLFGRFPQSTCTNTRTFVPG